MTDASSFKQWLLAHPILGGVFRLLAAVKKSNDTRQRTLKLEQRFEQLNNSLNERQQNLKLNIARTLAKKQNIDSNSLEIQEQQPLDNTLDDLYIAFENQFRGTAEEIKQQQVKYIPFLSAIAQNISEPLKVLDIGCGRGEWLHLLSEHNYEAL